MRPVHPHLIARVEHGRSLPVLVWRFTEPRLCISSGPLGGGIGARDWLVNATVPLDYDRTDPDRHLGEIGAALGLAGAGCGLLTAVDVTRHHLGADGGAQVTATVGLSSPAWAAAPDHHFRREAPHRVGTINIVVAAPVRLSEAALVNAVATATEAKAQALHEAGIRATGTASDAVVVHCPTDGAAEAFGGPRSTFGARIARAVHAAVLAGARSWMSGHAHRPPAGSRTPPRHFEPASAAGSAPRAAGRRAGHRVGADGIEPPTAGV
ncbi:adenosylcobinamide amidohydrolase [Mycobacterium avium]|uniref:adenosylcobinamide amidohydrolase n=1 Tax=Mycobacterium avium TaxID=1764 RepID=UPI0009BDE9EA|nr:adenosylcobinamide amidohydrolase [Mycobacterium avium]